ncbi:hypothetical protein HDU77_001716, partial [Chytriomyces hyalinus]
GDEMFFIKSGNVEICSEDGTIIFVTLTDGAFFGEIALFESCHRTATARAKGNCELCTLSKEDFNILMNLYPTVAEGIRETIRQRKIQEEEKKKQAELEATRLRAEEENRLLLRTRSRAHMSSTLSKLTNGGLLGGGLLAGIGGGRRQSMVYARKGSLFNPPPGIGRSGSQAVLDVDDLLSIPVEDNPLQPRHPPEYRKERLSKQKPRKMRLFVALASASAAAAAAATRTLILLEFVPPTRDFAPFRGEDAQILAATTSQHERFSQWLQAESALSSFVQIEQSFPAIANLFSGRVVSVDDSLTLMQVDAGLRRWSELKALHAVKSIPAPLLTRFELPQDFHSTKQSKRDTHSNSLIGLDEYTGPRGNGVTVCTIDTGVDYTHPSLGGCSKIGPGCRVSFGYDFAGDNFDPNANNTAEPDDDPMDCNGHGTHVAGIIMAQATNSSNPLAEGIAPNVTFGAYKVFGCSGATNSALVISAMDRAYRDNCTIVNLSLGSDVGMPNSLDAIAADTLASYGMLVVVAAGNDGALGAYRIASPAIAAGVTAVASVDSSDSFGRTVSIVGDAEHYEMQVTYSTPPVGLFSTPMVKSGFPLNSNATNDGCTPYPPLYFFGYAALIRRGECLFSVKAANAMQAGAAAVIFYNNDGDAPIGPVGSNTSIPVYTISQSSGKYIMDALVAQGNGNVQLSFSREDSLFYSADSNPRVSNFSSWGFGGLWRIKPDVSAPGGVIYSTYLMSKGGYAALSGTSMASPHMTAVYALALSYTDSVIIQSMNLAVVQCLIRLTSNPARMSGGNASAFASVAQQGSGLINIVNITQATTFIYPSVLESRVTPWGNATTLGAPETVTFKVNITNADVVAREYELSFVEAAIVAVDDPRNPIILPPPSQDEDRFTVVTFPVGKFSVAANGSAQIDISIRGPTRAGMHQLSQNSSAWLFSGWLFVTDDTGRRYTLAFGGCVGDFQEFSTFDTVQFPPFLSTLSHQNTTGSTSQLNVTFPSPETAANSSSQTLQDYLLINLHYLLPSPATVVYIFPASVAGKKAVQEALRVFVPTIINSTALEDKIQSIIQVQSALTGASIQAPPPSAVAMSQTVMLGISDRDNSAASAYTSLAWDGSSFFNGKSPFVGSGLYFAVVVSEGIYGEFGSASVFRSEVFRVDRGP